jgi:hypothetical protein
LIAAAEAIGWPAVVDYSTQSVEKRKAFETSFFKLLKLQAMSVCISYGVGLLLTVMQRQRIGG